MNAHDEIRRYAEERNLEYLKNEDGDIALYSSEDLPESDDFHSPESWVRWIADGQAYVWTC